MCAAVSYPQIYPYSYSKEIVVRLWSIHPKHLAPQGLVAVWHEALLAKKVLEGKTKGYKHHPQLVRFRACRSSIDEINAYPSQEATDLIIQK
jgi:hypothetical protein